ncbi:MAG: hypothetical protein AAF696_37515, partial [Bacteroidota bacterium]
YKVVITYGIERDTSYVKVIPDPRFELEAEVDEQLYQYQKAVDAQMAALSISFNLIDRKFDAIWQLEKQILDQSLAVKASLLPEIDEMIARLQALDSQGRTPKPDRQLGAWQTSEITPYSKVKDVQKIAMSSVRPISEQEKQLLREAELMVELFNDEVHDFFQDEWPDFIQKLKQANINWLVKLE